jgi:hypothetical protein
MSAQSFDDRIGKLDLSILQIESQTTPNDRMSLLAVQNVMRAAKDGYVYLECGSHIGGSLLPHVLDPRCRLIYSVDKRPAAQPDERGVVFPYAGNMTQRMLDTLAANAPAESMKKLRTFDLDASELNETQIDVTPDLVLIDAEHTIRAAFRDFLNLSKFCGPSTVYVFHDANLIYGALQNIETFLLHTGVVFDSYILRDVVFVLATNDARAFIKPLAQFGGNKEAYWRDSQRQLMQMHYDVVRNSRPATGSWHTGGTVTGRM